MKSASQLVCEAMRGRTARETRPNESDLPCAICGTVYPEIVEREEALPSGSFSGYADLKCQSSTAVCSACSWVMEGKPPDTIRLWSVLYREDREWAETKTEKMKASGRVCMTKDTSPILDILTRPPEGRWVCSIARSMKLHVLPYAEVNTGMMRVVVRMDRGVVRQDAEMFRKIIGTHARLRVLGFSRTEILERSPAIVKLSIHMREWREAMNVLGNETGKAVDDLAEYLLREENVNEYTGF